MASQAAQVLPVNAAQDESQMAQEEAMGSAEPLPRKAERAATADAGDVQEPAAKWRRITGKKDPGAEWVLTLNAKQLAERNALLERLAFQEQGAPAPAKAAYSLFFSEARQKAVEGDAKVSAVDLSRQIAKDWAALPPAEKSRVEAAAAADKERAKDELDAFKRTDAFRSLQLSVDRLLRTNSARRDLGEPEVPLKEWKKHRAAEQAEKSKAAKAEERGQGQASKKEQREHDALVSRLMRSLGSTGASGGASPPQPAQTPYVLFLGEVKGEEAAKGGSIAEVMKRIAARWSSLDASAKAPYVEQAAKDKERYERELEAFRASDAYKELSESATAFRSENSRRSTAGEAPRKLQDFAQAKRKDQRAKALASRKRGKLLASLLRRAPRSSGLRAAPKPPPAAYTLFAAAKKGEASGDGGSLPEVMKKLGAMWKEASSDEKATFAKEADAQKEHYETELKAFQLTNEYSTFVAAFEEWQREGKGAGAFWAWHGKRSKLKLALKRKEAREQAKIERAAARAAATAQARAARAAAKAKPKAAGAAKEAEDVPMQAALEEDPFWDSVGKGAAFDQDDLVLNDKLVVACARRGGPAASELLDLAVSRSTCATSLFRPRSADCPETSLHYALLRGDIEVLRILARETLRSSGGQAPAVVPKPVALGGSAEPEPAVAQGTMLWYSPRSGAGKLQARSGPAADAAEAPLVMVPGSTITVEECKGEWIKTAGEKWLPLVWNGAPNFISEDPERRRQRQQAQAPELRPVSTGFASGRAYRAKKLRKVKLSRGGREGNQAFVRDMGSNYAKPQLQLSEALHWAAERGVPLATLTACCELFRSSGFVDPATLLGSALRFGRAALARELVEKFGAGDMWGLNALHKLALKLDPTDEEIAESGKRKQSVVKKAQENFEVSPLHCASVGPEPRLLVAMLEPLGAGAEDQTRDGEERTLLHYAAAAETPAAVEMLLERRFSPHRTDKHGVTPLMCACMANRPENVKRLLAAGADPMVRADERTSFHWAVWYGAKEALMELLEHKAPGKVKGPASFEQAATSSKQTALHFACARGEEGIVQELLNRAPRSLHKPDKQGRTPLIWAVMNGHTKLASFLLSRGAIVSQADTSGNTPLHYALAYGWRDAARLLVDWGHEPDVQNTWRNTPVGAAILKAHFGAVAWFAANHPIDPDVKDEHGRTLLSRACGALENRQWRAVLRAVVESRGADVNLADGSGSLPICIAVRQCATTSTLHGEVEAALRSLCAAKADVSRKSQGQMKDQSAVSIALRGRNHGLLCLMLQSGAGVAVHGHGETLLHTIPERLITPDHRDESSSTAIVLDAIRQAVPREVLQQMARTPDKRGLLPIHAAALRFNSVMEQVRKQWEEYRKRQAMIEKQQKESAFGRAPVTQIEVKSEEAVLQSLRDLLLWLRAEADVVLHAPVAQLAEPWKWEEQTSVDVTASLGLTPGKVTEVVDPSTPAFDKELWQKYDPVFGLTTPLVMMVAGGCSAAVEWFIGQLHDAGQLERCLSAQDLYGNTPLMVALHKAGGRHGLMPEVIRRLVTPAAAVVRCFDGRTPLHLAAAGGHGGWGYAAALPPKCPKAAGPEMEVDSAAPAAPAPPGGQAKAKSYSEKIVDLWRRFKPENVANADSILAKYRGRELSAYLMVCKKNGVKPEREVAPAAQEAGGPPATPTAAGSEPTPVADPRAEAFEAVLAAAAEAGAANAADGRGYTPLHVAVDAGLREAPKPELFGGSAEGAAAASLVTKPGESVPMYELRGLAHGAFFGLPHCRVCSGAWYFELRHVRLAEGRVGFADARATIAGGGGASGEGLLWVPQPNSWPEDCTVGVALDADRCEVRIGVNGAWGSSPDLRTFKFERYLFPVIGGQGQCDIHLHSSSVPRMGSIVFRSFHDLGPFVASSQRMVGALLSARADASAVTADEHGITALHIAARVGDAGAVRRLCDAGAGPDASARKYGCTPLHFAMPEMKAGAGALAVAMALVMAKADVSLPTPFGGKGHLGPHLYVQQCDHQRFSLHDAVEQGPAALVELLVKAGADTNAPIEARAVSKCQRWLPLPSTDDEPSEPGSQEDRGLRVGEQVALRTDVAVQAVAPGLARDGDIGTRCLGDPDEEVEDVPAAVKAMDPFMGVGILRETDGRQHRGEVEDIERGAVSKKRLYRVRYEDGDLEHLVEDQVALAWKALQLLGVDEGGLEKAVSIAVAESAVRGLQDDAVLAGKVVRIQGDGNYELGDGDFAKLLESPEALRASKGAPAKLIMPRGSLLRRMEVESVQVRVGRPLHRAAERNSAEAVRALLQGRADPSVPDGKDGRLALHHAVEHRNVQAVKALIAAGTALDTQDATKHQARPLLSAVKSALAGKGLEVLEELLKAGAGIDLPCAADGFTALHLAAAARSEAVVDVLLRHRADPSVQDSVGRTPLHKAVNAAAPSEPSFDVERKLLDAGAPVNALDKRGRTPLHYAFVKEGNPWDVAFADPVETVTSLCAVEGVLVDVVDEFGATPLLYAARRGATISSLYLAKRGVALQARDVHENDVLGTALAAGHHEYAITLLSKDAGDVNAPMRHVRAAERPAGDAAAQATALAAGGERPLNKLLGVSVGPPLTLFYEAIKNKWLGLAYLLLDHGFPFHRAIQDSLSLGEFRLVLTLLSKINPAQNELVTGLDADGRNLLHVLADFPDKLGPEAGAISKELAQRGVQPGQADGRGRLPLHCAAANGHFDLSRWLLSVTTPDTCLTRSSNGQVPLHGVSTRRWLQKHGEASHVQFLGLLLPGNRKAASEPFLDDTIDPRTLPKDLELPVRSVPLVNAVACGFGNSAAKLLDAQADCNARDGLGETALGAALQANDAIVVKLVQLLLFNGADANLRDRRGNTPLRGAVRSPRSLQLVEDLVQNGARVTEDPGQQPAGGSLVLDAMLAVPSTAAFPVPQVLERLLELKAQPDQGADEKGRPPLILAVASKRTKVFEALVAAGAALGRTDAAGRSALTVAIDVRGEMGPEVASDPNVTLTPQGMALALLVAKADPQVGRDAGGRPPLFAAVKFGDWEAVDALLTARADANRAGTDDCGRAPLSIAVRANAGAVAMSLLSALADPNAQDKHGRTAAHHCVQPLPYGSYENADLLAAILKARGGRDSALMADGEGRTAVQLAAAQGSGRMVALLAREGLCEKPSRPTSLSALSMTAEPTGAAPDIDADALAELERIEASATPMPLPVHSAYGMAGDNKVFEQEGVEHDALLFKVDLKRNEMRFYHLQLVYEVNKDLYVLFTRWGEIGETGMYQRTPQASLEEGLKEFGKVFKEKTGNVWATKDTDFERKPNKYQLLRRRRAVTRHDQLLRKFETERRSALSDGVQRAVRAMCDPVMVGQALASLGIKTQSMPFGSLSRATLNEAKELLGAIRLANEELRAMRSVMDGGDPMEAAKKRNDVRERVLELSSRYYELVPRNAGSCEVARPLEGEAALAKEFEALIDLAEASVGVQLLLGALHRQAEEHPFDYCLRGLGISIEEVDPASEEFAMMLRYAQSTCTGGEPPRAAEPGDFVEVVKPAAGDAPPKRNRQRPARSHDVVTAIYRLARRGEAARFVASGSEDLPNRRMLWHGSRLSNMIGIMTQGLRVAPPEAPVSGYMFGKGVYFADMFSKSRQYCRSSSTNEPAYMMLCDVALGEMHRCREAQYMDAAPSGTHSTWGQGLRTPDWANQIVEPGGAALPKAKLADAGERKDYRLNYNEFIVYDPAQIQMRYLIELNNFERHGEETADASRAAKRPKLAH